MADSYPEDDWLPLSGVQHYAFCPRQWALIHVEQQWADNERTVDGDRIHERCHDASIRERRGELLVVRGLRVTSRRLGLIGVCDVVEFRKSSEGARLYGEDGLWMPTPVEYKKGSRKVGDEDRLQVCAQAMCMEEMLCCRIGRGFVFYDAEKGREEVQFDEGLRSELTNLVNRMHDDFKRGYTPKAKRRRHCNACSLKDVCEPQLGKMPSVATYMDRMLGDDGA